MRIGFDGRYIQDQYHGIGRYAYELLRHLIQLGSRHTFVIVWNPDLRNTRFDLEGLLKLPRVETVEHRTPLYWPQDQIQLPILAWRRDLDVMHVPYFAAPLGCPCPLIVTIHDLIFERFPSYMPRRWARTYYRAWTASALRRSAAVLTVSEATRRDLETHYRLSSDAIRVTPLATDAGYRQATAEQKAEVRQRYGLPEQFVLVVGARRPHKNVAAVVRAFGRVCGQIPQSLVLVGEADRRFADPVPALIAELGLGDRVLHVPHVPEDDLPTIYASADVLACPSLIEGFGLPVLEAMSCGLPVVTSRGSSLAEVGSDAALLVDPTDDDDLAAALLRVLSDASLHADLKARGMARARTFSWERAAQQTLEAYEYAGERRPVFAGVGHHAE